MKKNILWFLILIGMVQCPVSVFADEYIMSDWARKEITTPEKYGIDNFKSYVSREKFCEIVCEFLDEEGVELDSVEENPKDPRPHFSDTDNPSVMKLYYAGTPYWGSQIIYGKSDYPYGYGPDGEMVETLFAPNDYIKREEAAKILFGIHYTLNRDTVKLNKKPPVGEFIDDKDISGWAYTAVYIMASQGVEVMFGDGDDCLYYPKNNMTVEQAIVAAQRLAMLEKELGHGKS